MIKNLEDFSKLEEMLEIIHYKLDIVEEIPEKMPKFSHGIYDPKMFSNHNMNKEMALKEAYNDLGMFAFVSWKWVNPLVKWLDGRKCLEVMAGRGWLSHALRQKGVDVIATDDYSWSNTRGWDEPLTEVIDLDAVESINKYGSEVDIVIIGWPYMDDTAYKVIKKLHEVNPLALVIYIGEGGGGCTASDKFHESFSFEDSDEDFWEKVASNYESWNLIHDSLYLGKYVEGSYDE